MLEIEYDPLLVGISVAVAIWGSWTALVLTFGFREHKKSPIQAIFLCINGAVVIGSSIWAMHFIAMLAVGFPVPVTYNVTETVASLVLAMCVSGLGLFVASQRVAGALSVLTGGTLMGLGIAGMHYLGMSAIRGCGITYNEYGVLASVLIAILAASAALWFAFRRRGIAETVLGGVIMGFAIASMHYTGMYATAFYSSPSLVPVQQPLLSQPTLAYAIALATITVCSAQLLLVAGATKKPLKQGPGIS